MKSTRLLLVVALVSALATGALATSGCSKKDVAAKVNGDTIPTSAVDDQLDQLKKQYPNLFTGTDSQGKLLEFKQRIVDTLVDAKLIEQAAKEKGISVTDADVQQQIDRLKGGFKDEAQFEAALNSAGMTLDSLAAAYRQQLVANKLAETLAADQPVTDQDIQDYYNANRVEFEQRAQKRASHILFKLTDKATALKVLKRLKAGTVTFSAAAKKYSIDTATAVRGGDLGWPTAAYVPEFAAAVAKLGKGQVSGLVQSTFGYHIILVTDMRPAREQPLAEVKATIQQIIAQRRKGEAYAAFLAELRKSAKIEVLLDDLNASAATTAGSATATATKP